MLTSVLLTRACRGGSTCNLRSHFALIARIARKSHRRQRNEHRGLFWDRFNRISIGLSEHKKNIHILIFKNPLLYSAKWGSKSLCDAETCFCTAESAKFKILVCAKPSRYRCRKQVHPFEEHFLRDRLYKWGNYIKVRPFEECFLMDLLYKWRNYMKNIEKNWKIVI